MSTAQFGIPDTIFGVDIKNDDELEGVDLDVDGDLDLLVSVNDSTTILWFENVNGQGEFVFADTIKALLGVWTVFEVADLNGDGAPDMVIDDSDESTVYWIENDGNGSFGPDQSVDLPTTGYGIPRALKCLDVVGDAGLEIVQGSDSIRWVPNLSGQFQQRTTTIASPGFSMQIFGMHDFDLDGDKEILFSPNYGLYLLKFDQQTSTWVDTLVSNDFYTGPPRRDVHLVDVDLDGDMDLIGPDISRSLWKNLTVQGGNQMFQRVDFFQVPPASMQSGFVGQTGCTPALNMIFGYTTYHLYTYDLGAGNFIQGPTVDLAFASSRQLLADFNGDGRDDLVAAPFWGAEIYVALSDSGSGTPPPDIMLNGTASTGGPLCTPDFPAVFSSLGNEIWSSAPNLYGMDSLVIYDGQFPPNTELLLHVFPPVTLSDSCPSHSVFNFSIEVCTDVPSILEVDELHIYPNPASGIAVIELGSDKVTKVSIFDVVGKLMYTEQASDQLRFDVGSWPAGVYFVTVQGQERRTARMMVE